MWGRPHPFFAKVRARVRTPGSPHSLSPPNQTTAASPLPSPSLHASPVGTLLWEHLFWVCWLHQRPARRNPVISPGRPSSPPQAPVLTPEMLLSLLYHLQPASSKTPRACTDLITDYLCCLPTPQHRTDRASRQLARRRASTTSLPCPLGEDSRPFL